MEKVERRIKLYEVGFRDWRFCHRATIDTASIIKIIRMQEEAGMGYFELGASVNYDKYPEVKDTYQILRVLNKRKNPGSHYSIYVGPAKSNYPKRKIKSLLDQGKINEHPGLPDEICLSISASEERNLEIYKMPGSKVLDHIREQIDNARADGMKVRGYVSAAFGYKNGEDVPISNSIGLCQMLLDYGCYEVAIGDTRGKADPQLFLKKWKAMKSHIPLEKIALHFHSNWYTQWEIDIMQVLADGISTFDTSILDIPEPMRDGKEHEIPPRDNQIPPNASTQKMVYFINQLNEEVPDSEKQMLGSYNFTTGIDLRKIEKVGELVRKKIKEQNPSIWQKISRLFL